jgi:hypothetical protein
MFVVYVDDKIRATCQTLEAAVEEAQYAFDHRDDADSLVTVERVTRQGSTAIEVHLR